LDSYANVGLYQYIEHFLLSQAKTRFFV
jgi:hypothetical protein